MCYLVSIDADALPQGAEAGKHKERKKRDGRGIGEVRMAFSSSYLLFSSSFLFSSSSSSFSSFFFFVFSSSFLLLFFFIFFFSSSSSSRVCPQPTLVKCR